MFYTGGITGNVPSYGNIENPGEFGPYISIAGRVLTGNREKALELMMEILSQTDFSDRKRLRELVAEIRSRMLYSLVQSGHSTAMLRALSYGSAASLYTDKLSGIEFFKYINELSEQIKTDEGADELARKLTALREKLFVRNGMVVSLTSPADDFEPFAAALEKAVQVLAAGGKVYLTPPSTKEALPHSIQAQFSTDFWSVGCFPNQEGGMGQLIDAEHPLFDAFPTAFHSEWQWWPMAGRQAMILPERMDTIITEMDSCAFLRPMAMLFECRCGAGRMLVSSLGLHELQHYPEARALQRAVYRYLDSGAFNPRQQVSPDEIRSIFRADVS
jgi:hypothetical protein